MTARSRCEESGLMEVVLESHSECDQVIICLDEIGLHFFFGDLAIPRKGLLEAANSRVTCQGRYWWKGLWTENCRKFGRTRRGWYTRLCRDRSVWTPNKHLLHCSELSYRFDHRRHMGFHSFWIRHWWDAGSPLSKYDWSRWGFKLKELIKFPNCRALTPINVRGSRLNDSS